MYGLAFGCLQMAHIARTDILFHLFGHKSLGDWRWYIYHARLLHEIIQIKEEQTL
jgi:hypothetical protein